MQSIMQAHTQAYCSTSSVCMRLMWHELCVCVCVHAIVCFQSGTKCACHQTLHAPLCSSTTNRQRLKASIKMRDEYESVMHLDAPAALARGAPPPQGGQCFWLCVCVPCFRDAHET